MRFFVTGATGFIGSWLVRHLIDEGHEVSVLSRRESIPPELTGLPIQVIRANLNDSFGLAKAFKGHEGVFHLAGYVGYKKSEREIMHKVNVDGTKCVVEACKLSSIKRLVHFSSVNAIGASFDKSVLDENAVYNLSKFHLGYSETKKESEAIVKAAAQDLDVVILNPSTVYGPGDALKGSRSTQVKVAKGKFPFYTDGGVSVADIQQIIKATLAAYHKGRSGERYILAGENLSIKQVFDIITDCAGVSRANIKMPSWLVFSLGKFGDVMESLGSKGPVNSESAVLSEMYHWFSSAKAERELGYKPTSARAAIESSVNWMKEQGLLNA